MRRYSDISKEEKDAIEIDVLLKGYKAALLSLEDVILRWKRGFFSYKKFITLYNQRHLDCVKYWERLREYPHYVGQEGRDE